MKNKKTKQKKLTPKQIALDYLKKSSFSEYQKYPSFQKKIDQQIKKALSGKNAFNLTIPFSEIKPLVSQNSIYSVELGGTFLHLFQSKVNKGKVEILKQKKIDFYQAKTTYTPKVLFQDLQKSLDAFIPAKERAELKQIYLFFAFPIKPALGKNGQLEGTITYFGKAHKNKDIIGLKVAQSLEKHLRSAGYKQIQISVTNDGLGNLLAGLADNKLPLANLIAGTGTNLSVAYQKKGHLHLSNLEFGDFPSFPAATFDKKLATSVPAPLRARYLAEKMFAGTWQNQLLNIIAKDLLTAKSIKSLPDAKLATMTSGQMQEYFNQAPSKIQNAKKDAFLVLSFIWNELSLRGAFICAFTINRLCKALRLKPQILLSGAILSHNKTFQQKLRKSLPKAELIQFEQNTPKAAAILNQILGHN